MPNRTTPIKLQKNVRYPSYQLYAIAGDGKDPESAMVICILHVYEWLRERFSAYEIKEFQYPLANAWQGVSLRDFVSIKSQEEYPYEIICIPEDKVWTLQLTEPDNGTEDHAAVKGRTFETNIAFRITEKGVECGFRTMVTEPADTKDKCDSYRLACIKKIARDENVGLFHEFKLVDTPVDIQSAATEKKLAAWINNPDRQMAVIAVMQEPEMIKISIDISEMKYQSRTGVDVLSGFNLLNECQKNEDFMSQPTEIVDAAEMARYKMGYVQYFTVSRKMIEKFSKDIKVGLSYGDVLIAEPKAFGGKKETLTFSSKLKIKKKHLEKFASEYCSKKPMTFGQVMFVPDAKEIEREKVNNAKLTKQQLIDSYEERIAAIKQQHAEELETMQSRLNLQCNAYEKLEDQLSELRASGGNQISIEEFNTEIDLLKKTIEEQQAKLDRIATVERRPKDTKDIASWVEAEFDGKMLLHQRAKDMLGELKSGEWDIPLICDSLEYLANEYRDCLLGSITEDDKNNICSVKYQRPFDVSPLKFETIAKTPKEYKVKYGLGYTGKPVDKALDLHLKIGNQSEDLIRIYFLYDKEKKLIVVGSLPKHLPTLSYK